MPQSKYNQCDYNFKKDFLSSRYEECNFKFEVQQLDIHVRPHMEISIL